MTDQDATIARLPKHVEETIERIASAAHPAGFHFWGASRRTHATRSAVAFGCLSIS